MTRENVVEPGGTFFAWTVVVVDELGRRALCICACGAPREISVDALLDGTSARGCGCKRTPAPRRSPVGVSSFAADVAGAEGFAATYRHKVRGRL
jgi:hypothetical protein